MHSGMFVFTAIERIVFGQPAATALRAEAHFQLEILGWIRRWRW